MTGIGDKDPEDVWDDADPVDAKLAVLERVVAALAELAIVPAARSDDALRLVAKLERFRSVDRDRLIVIRRALEAY